MTVSTTPFLEGRRAIDYHGVVVGEANPGADVVRDLFGGRSDTRTEELGKARTTALREMEDHARARGGNAVVGADLDDKVINNMLMVSASGTAVTIAQE